MKKTKLISLFQTLRKEEYKPFLKFLRYRFTERSSYNSLFRYLVKKFNKQGHTNFDEDEMHAQLFPDLSRKSFQNVLSDASKVVEEYLVWLEVQSTNTQKDLLLLSALKKRGAYELFDKKSVRVKKDLDHRPFNIWNNMYRMQIDHLQYFSENPIKALNGQKMLQSLLQNFNNFVDTHTLFYQAEIHNRSNWENEAWDNEILPPNFQKSASSSLEEILRHLVLIQSGDGNSYAFLSQIILENITSIDKDLQSIILIHLHKYLNNNIRNTEERGKQKLKLFSLALKHDILYLQANLPPIRFHNIVDTACRLQEFEWVNDFIDSCKDHLQKSIQADTIKLAQAQVYFALKDRNAAQNGIIKLLYNLSFSDFRQELRARTMLICAYYESHYYKDDLEFVKNAVNSYKRFIERRKDDLSKNEFTSLLNLVEYIRVILRKSPPNLSELLANVNKEKVFFKSWLIARIQELQTQN